MKSVWMLVMAAVGLLAGCREIPKPGEMPADMDGDGYNYLEDCDDTDEDIYPGAPEVCDGVDQNCDGEDDTLYALYVDRDGDGYGLGGVYDYFVFCAQEVQGYSDLYGDCDDSNGDVHPWAWESCDGLDNDCDAKVDESPYTDLLTDSLCCQKLEWNLDFCCDANPAYPSC